MLDRPPAARPPHRVGALGIADQRVDALGEVVGEPLRIARRAGAVVAGLDRHQQAGLAVVDDLDDPAGGGRHDGGLARHRLEVDDPERLVDRRAGEHGRVAEQLDHVGLGQHLLEPDDAVALGPQLADASLDLGAELGRVRGAGAEHELRGRVEACGRRAAGTSTPFWRVIRPTNTTERPLRVDPETLEHVGPCVGASTASCRCRCR